MIFMIIENHEKLHLPTRSCEEGVEQRDVGFLQASGAAMPVQVDWHVFGAS